VYALPQTRPDGHPTLELQALGGLRSLWRRAWDIVVDAAQPEVERIVAAWQLFALAPTEATARRLGALWREPTLWLGSEIVEIVRAIGADLAIGVDERGLLAVSPSPLSALVQDGEGWVCPDVGRVVPLEDARELRSRLADVLPWLIDPWNDPYDRVLAVAYRFGEVDVFRQQDSSSSVPRASAALIATPEQFGLTALRRHLGPAGRLPLVVERSAAAGRGGVHPQQHGAWSRGALGRRRRRGARLQAHAGLGRRRRHPR